MKNRILKQKGRIVVAGLYLLIMVGLYFWMLDVKGMPFSFKDDSINWLLSGALLLILGKYISEPIFSTPADAIVNSITAILVLINIDNTNQFLLYYPILIVLIIVFCIALIAVWKKDDETNSKYFIYKLSKLGSYKFIFTLIYGASTYSYLGDSNLTIYSLAILLWMFVMCYDFISIGISKLTKNIKQKHKEFLGTVVKILNTRCYEFEIAKGKDLKIGNQVIIKLDNKNKTAVIVDIVSTLGDRKAIAYLIENNVQSLQIIVNIKGTKDLKQNNKVYKIENEIESEEKLVTSSKNFIGFVSSGSNIEKLNIELIVKDRKIEEGSILETKIYGKKVMYQVIDGITKTKNIDSDTQSCKVNIIARKLGYYNKSNNMLEVVKWVPNNFQPVFIESDENIDDKEEKLKNLAAKDFAIGRLPNTLMGIKIKDYDSLVTHNTAILGILGVGKSCIAYEAITKLVNEGTKVICIDITNEYNSDIGLKNYLDNEQKIYQYENTEGYVVNYPTNLFAEQAQGIIKKANNKYREIITNLLKAFVLDNKQILIINPNNNIIQSCIKTGNMYYKGEMTLAQKTRIISEVMLDYAMKNIKDSEITYTNDKLLLVFEEAHSLIPEWNSAANDGDGTATNGTVRVILQGRKYGLGCMVITQRTANVSKSILNQCNTVFALRIFDDTGKNFLGNYLGSDYANLLPTLDERHAILVGKGFKLKQPVIVQLNERCCFGKFPECKTKTTDDSGEELEQSELDEKKELKDANIVEPESPEEEEIWMEKQAFYEQEEDDPFDL